MKITWAAIGVAIIIFGGGFFFERIITIGMVAVMVAVVCKVFGDGNGDSGAGIPATTPHRTEYNSPTTINIGTVNIRIINNNLYSGASDGDTAERIINHGDVKKLLTR